MDREPKTYKIRLWGIVQGVGFRPFVAKMAARMGIKGEVRNTGGLVEIVLTDSSSYVKKWVETLKAEKPEPAEILHIKIEEVPYRLFVDFKIIDSREDEEQIILFPPDLATCPACTAEAKNPANPRYRHPFISCMICGPRYTIIDRMPYDRGNTAMDEFTMCPLCEKEYTDRQERRYHAQTVSCHDCGPVLMKQGKENSTSMISGRSANEQSMQSAIAYLQQGEVIALKGIGGYYFVCRADSDEAAYNLRQLKHREQKPFAVMFDSLEQIKEACFVSETEANLLCSTARPIVLLKRRSSCKVSPEVYKSSGYLGAFLPGMALQSMLIEETGPLVMTSANLSDMPIIKDEGTMFVMLQEPLLKAVFYHEREIRVRLDDSVVRVIDDQPQIIRRSKGYVPSAIRIGEEGGSPMLLAVGGQLKAAFCLVKGPFAYMSQHFGDLENSESMHIYEKNIDRMQKLFGIKPNAVICDLHPRYLTTEYAKNCGLPVMYAQHHHAHIASVMAESALTGPVIGVAFDGTGYGVDGRIWGGEFLICEKDVFERAAHLNYVSMLGGDSSMKQAWKSAMCHMIAADDENDICEPIGLKKSALKHRYREDIRYDTLARALAAGINKIETSSMGRLFDAVAALCGIGEENRYEGECAALLEEEAAAAREQHITPLPMTFLLNRTVRKEEEPDPITAAGRDAWAAPAITTEDDSRAATAGQTESLPWIIETAPVIRAVSMAAGGTAEQRAGAALGFHKAVAQMIGDVCQKIREERGIMQVALAGGVFQNKLLMEESLTLLRRSGFEVHYNTSVPPGDGGIALGQAYIAKIRLAKQSKNE